MSGKISVIVPIYNGEAYIPKMLESLRNQTYKDFEVLLVDDHSTDKSKMMLKDICRKDDRFKLLKPVEKMGTAVKGQEYAIPYCKGDYHFFLSQDDFMDIDFFEKCMATIEAEGADVVIPNCILYYGEERKEKLGEYPIKGNYEIPLDSRKAFELSIEWKIHGFTIERMDLFKRVGLRADFYNSEEYYKRLLFLDASKIFFVDTNFYYRQDNPNAITKKRNFFHVDILLTDFMLYKKMVEKGYSKTLCRKHLKRITIECLKWYYRGIRYGLWYKKNCYALRMLLKTTGLLACEWAMVIGGRG